jgi:hypothetical protein
VRHNIGVALFVAAVFPLLAYAQPDTVNVPGYFESGNSEGTLNTAVNDAKNAGKLSTTVFKLKIFERYVLTETITIPLGEHLTIVADEPGTAYNEAPPQILWSASGGITTSFNFDCFGDITLKNVWLSYMNTAGNQTGTSLKIEANPDSAAQQYGTFEGCLFDYSLCPSDASGAIDVTSKHFVGKFTNCFFRNCSDPHFRYYGRAVSFPYNTTGWHTDSLSFVNCSFTNMGYVIMQEAGEYADYIWINHCTFVNTAMFCLESTWWYYLSVANSVFLNTFMYGDIGENNGNPNGGTFPIDSVSNFGFTPPFTDPDRHILFINSSYAIDSWLADYMAHNPYSDTVTVPNMIPKPMPMLNPRSIMFFDTTDGQGNKIWPYMNRKNLYDGVNPDFLVPPTDIPAIERFLYYKWTTNADTNWAYNITASVNQDWPTGENLKIPTSNPLKTAGLGGFPLGDLYRWDRSKYNSWKLQESSENAQILAWLTDGITGVAEERPGVPMRFELSQNYPNPFNPTTQIIYSVPQKSNVTLKVFNVLGVEVATLFSGVQDAGKHATTFDAAKLSSGVYFYRLQAGSVSITKKMLFVK